jgi:glycosyltransferase involved in cell wall biosynthesis
MDEKKHYILFRSVPTMRCNYRCKYCFVSNEEKSTQQTLFDMYPASKWVEAMGNFSDYRVEFYFWGGEPFILDGTYELVKGWTDYNHVIGGCRIDTNMSFTDKIIEKCPTNKVKLNCSWHTQYDSFDRIYEKVKKLRRFDMVGMVNFVASEYNLNILRDRYNMSIDGLIRKFDEIGVFVNIAADFAIVNGKDPVEYADYKKMILKYLCPEDWKQLRGEKGPSLCRANQHYFTLHANGDIKTCLSNNVCGNFFDGTLQFSEEQVCSKNCPSLVSYGFRMDNSFCPEQHIVEYVKRNYEYRKSLASTGLVLPAIVKNVEPKSVERPEEAPAVSIVLPTYNQFKYLPKALDSVFSQTFTDFELIVVNDGSTDETRDYLDSLRDPRVRVIHQENRKLPSALNRGFDHSRGEFLTWVSSDNYLSPLFLQTFVSALQANPQAGLAYSAFIHVDQDDNIIKITRSPGLDYRRLLLEFPGMASFMYRRCCQDKVGLYDASLEGAEDWDMWLRIAEHFGLLYVPDVLCYYRHHEASMTCRVPEAIAKSAVTAFENAVSRLRLDVLYPGLRSVKDQRSAELYACLNLAAEIMQSKWSGTSAATGIMKSVFAQLPDSVEAANNLALATAISGQWDQMDSAIAVMSRSANETVLNNLRLLEQARQSRNVQLLKPAVIFKADENKLAFLKQVKNEQPDERARVEVDEAGIAADDHTKQSSIEYFNEALLEFENGQYESAHDLMERYRRTVDYRSLSRFTRGEKDREVDVSVVIVTYNRTEDLRQCVRSVAEQTTSREKYEIVVVDNGGTDESVIKPLCDQYIKCPVNFYLSEGRNIGACFARGRIIAFLDDDAVVSPDYIGSIEEAFDKYDIFGFRGRVLPKTSPDVNSIAVNYDRGDKVFCTFCDQEGNSAFLKEVYLDTDGMDPLLFGHEGTDLSYRIIRKYGFSNRIIYWPRTIIYHDVTEGQGKLEKEQRYRLISEYLQLKHDANLHALRESIETEQVPARYSTEREPCVHVDKEASPVGSNICEIKPDVNAGPSTKELADDVPVALIVYNRPKHTYEVLRALKEHNIKNLYIFSDAPRNQEDAEKVSVIRKLCRTIDWTEPKIIERPENIGLARNIVSAVDLVFQEHDRLILLEDDCVPQRYFFDFMRTCLAKYQENDKIFGVSGYTVQIPEHILQQWPYDAYFYPRIGSWGWATWERAWRLREKDLRTACNKARQMNIDICRGGNDILKMIDSFLAGSLKDVWTLNWVITVYLNNGYYVYPTAAHVDNIGMDGSGVHIGKTDKFNTKMANCSPMRFSDKIIVNPEIYNNFRKFYDVPDYPKSSVAEPEEMVRPVEPASVPASAKDKSLKIVHVCTHDYGGAGRAAYRLHKALQSIGHNSSMLVISKKSDDPDVHVAKSSASYEEIYKRNRMLLAQFAGRPVGLEMYSDNFSVVDLAAESLIQQADVVNLHWVAGVLNYDSIRSALKDKIIVWTLHDMNPFTGGCHYAGDCEKYKQSCGRCFQLGPNQLQDLSSHVWHEKKRGYDGAEITVVTPSRWLAECSKNSGLLSGFKTEVIPNSLPVDVYKPCCKGEIRAALNIREDAKVILFGAGSVVNERKGFRYLLEAVKTVELDEKVPICIATFGGMPKHVQVESRYPVFNFGPLSHEQDLAALYSIADVFVLPSLEDNLPNIVLEAMACGIPVVGFEVGGIPDMVEHKKTGYLVRPKDIEGLKEGIKWVLAAKSQGIDLSRACRDKIEKLYTPSVQAKAYESLYYSASKNVKPIPSPGKIQSFTPGFLVSAIVSTYNSERFIRGCLEDLEGQTIADRIEIIVVNSGSQQNEDSIVKEFQQKYGNIKYIKTLERETIYQAWNRAIEAASGKYITVANTDDRRRKDAIEVMANVLEANRDIALVYADQYETSNENEMFANVVVSRKNIYPDFEPEVFLALGWCNMGSQPMWRAAIHKDIGYFDGNFEIAGDYDFLLKVCEKYKCFHIRQVLGTFYRSAGRTVSCGNTFRLGRVENPLAKARSLVRKGIRCIEQGEHSNGVEYLQKSMQCWPSKEAVEYIQKAEEKMGERAGSRTNIGFEFLASVWAWPKEMVAVNKARPLVADFNDAHFGKYLLTVIIAGCKCVEEIRSCLEQLMAQSIADRTEVQLVTDQPSKYLEMLEQYSVFADIRGSKLNQGEAVFSGVNRAIKSSTGRFVTLLKPGYKLDYNSLGQMAGVLDEDVQKAAVCTSVVKKESDFGPMMWRRCLHERLGWFDDSFYTAAELEFRFRIEQDYDFAEVPDNTKTEQDSIQGEYNLDYAFETGLIKKAYNYARLCSIHIGHGGISCNEILSCWFEFSILRKRTWEKLHEKEYDPIVNVSDNRQDAVSPLLSVVIVTCGRDNALKESLNALASQTEKNFEVIIVNNGGSHQGMTISSNLGICRIDLDNNYGPSLARNAGAGFSKARHLAFLDDDAAADSDFVKNIISHFKQSNIVGLRGKILSPCGGYIPEMYDLGNEAIPYAADMEGNCAFRKDAFIRLGGFSEWLFHGEGIDLSYRIFKSAGEDIDCMFYFPDVIIYHQPYGNQLYRLERIARSELMRKLLEENNPGIDKYLDFMFNFYQCNRKGIEQKLGRLFNNALFLLDKKPERALEWAKMAVELNPDAVGSRLLLGSAYLRLGDHGRGQCELEWVVDNIDKLLISGASLPMQEGETEERDIGEFYLQAAILLAQSYSAAQNFAAVKKLYERVLKNPKAKIPQQHRAHLQSVLQRLQRLPAQNASAPPECSGQQSRKRDDEFLVSAIVSTYNAEQFIRGCLEDLENQTIADKLEIIVVNSCSQQNEEAIVREFQARYGNIVYLRTEQKERVYKAWNRAVKVARGRFITNANTDDRHRPDALEIMSNELINNPDIALVYADQICTDTPNATFEKHNALETYQQPDYSRERLLLGCCVGSQPMWRRSLHQEFGYFDESLDCAGDWDFWLRVSERYPFKHIPQFLGLYYFNRKGIEHGNHFHSYYERYAVGRRYGTEYISTFNTYHTERSWLVSVIMPAYNAQKYIRQAIESVLIQNYRHFELVIINDGSTDKTEEIILSYNDEHIRYFKQPNRGLAATHNEGIRQSRGEFLIKVDADDFIAVDFIGRHLNEFYNHRDVDMVYCDDYLLEEDGTPIRIINRPEYTDRTTLISDLFRAGFPVVPFRTCIQRRVFEKIGLFDECLRIGEDYDMMRRFVKAGLKAHHLKAALYYRRLASESLSRHYSYDKAQQHFAIVKSYAETFGREELFPGVHWEKIPSGIRDLHFKCLTAMNFISLGQSYIESNLPSYAAVALECAGQQLERCLEIDPGNEAVTGLMERCRRLEKSLSQTELVNV